MDELILNQLSNRLQEIGNELGFHKLIKKSSAYISKIYVVNKHALQLEVDWRENDLFMYAVYLKNNKLPDAGVIYRYSDGQWCRKYLEEIYRTKRPIVKDKNKRYSSKYFFDVFEFYMQLINGNPDILRDFGTGTRELIL